MGLALPSLLRKTRYRVGSSGSTQESGSRFAPAQAAVVPLAFDRVSLETTAQSAGKADWRLIMYLPISLGGIVIVVLVLWLLG